MDPGYLAGESVRPFTPADIVWIERGTGESVGLTSAGWFAWSKSPRLAAFLCNGCGIIELHFQPDRTLSM